MGPAFRGLLGRFRFRPQAALDVLARTGSSVQARGRELAPVARRGAADLGKMVGRGAAASGRGAVRLGRRCLVELRRVRRPLGRAARRGLAAGVRMLDGIGRATLFAGNWLWRHRGGLGALALRALWWGALALLWLGGRALLAAEAPLVGSVLPLFVIGVGLCLPLFFARAVQIRWAGLGLGLGHAVLAVFVWSVGSA